MKQLDELKQILVCKLHASLLYGASDSDSLREELKLVMILIKEINDLQLSHEIDMERTLHI